MSHKRKVTYLILLGVAVLALAVDQFVIGEGSSGPAAARGETVANTVPAVTGRTPDAGAADAGPTPIPELPFPRSLPPFDPALDVRDPFAMPPDVRSRLAGGSGDGSTGESDVEPSGVARFAAKGHRLGAVLMFAGRAAAYVDGSRMRVGDALDDCTLESIEIERGRARFACSDGTTTLTTFPIIGREP